MSVTVLIAARDEETWIGRSVASAVAAGADEVLVVDGGSTDRTREIASSAGAKVVDCDPMRSRQFNRGAEIARGEALIFLHADTMLPPGACAAVEGSLEVADFGGFRIRFSEDTPGLRFAAFMINLRTRITRSPWGDQAQFVRRETFLRGGGFREIPLMDDYELAARFRKRVVLPLTVTTSGRRFLRNGLVRTTALNWTIVLAWHLRVSPERLARWYRGAV